MITNLPFMRKISSNILLCLLFTLLFSGNLLAQTVTVTNVSPLRVTGRTPITVTGTNFTSTSTVKVGGTNAASVKYVSATSLIITATTSGTVAVTRATPASTGTSTQSVSYVAGTTTTTTATTSRITSDFNGAYWVSSSSTVPNNDHNLTSFTYGGLVYTTGVNDAQVSANNVSPLLRDFRGFVVGTNLPGSTPSTGTSNYLVFGKNVDGNLSTGVVTHPSIAGKKVRDLLTDGTKGLNIGSGVTNVDVSMLLDFGISHITPSKITDSEPDIIISQIADPSNGNADLYAFTDINGNVIGSIQQNNFSNITALNANSIDFFTLTANTSFNTAVATTYQTTGETTRPMRVAAFKLSDFGITEANASSIAYFKVFPGGDMDPGFFSYNADAITALPYITTQPVSQSVCTGNSVNVTFTVAATSTDAISYQWKKNGVNITGATSASYTISNVVSSDVAAYTVVLTNIAGSVTSDVANLTSIVTNTATWTGATNSNWNTATNWTCNTLPSATVSALIPVVGTVYPTLSSITGTCKDLTIAANASVTITGSGILNIAGAISNSGALNAVDGTLAFIGTTGAQNIPTNALQSSTIKNLTVNNTAGLTINSNTNLTGILALTAGTLTTGNHLTLKSNVNTTAMVGPVTGAVSGDITVERYIPARRAFRFLSSPTTGGTIKSNWQEGAPTTDPVGLGTDITGAGGVTNGFDVSGSNNPSLFTYLNQNPAAGTSWFAVTSTTATLNAGVPYRILVRGDRTVNQSLNNSPASITTLRTTGAIKTGDVVVTDLNQNASGFSLIGNPYQAPVDMAAMMTDASTLLNKNFYYVWDPTRNTKGAYVTVTLPAGSNNFSGSVANKYLQPGQACFIQTATAGAATLTFKESHKYTATATAAIFKAEENPANMVFTLYDSTVLAANGVAADAFVVRFDENYTNDVDAFDAIKPTNQDENIGLMNSGKILSYESRSLPVASDVIPISQTQYRTTSYVYKVAVNGLSNVNAYLLDKLTNTRTALINDSETSVAFTVDNAVAESIAANRFDIVFENLLATSENAFANALKIYPNPASDKFFVKLPSGADGAVNVKLVNALGQTVYSTTGVSENGILKVQPKNTLQSGIYMVHISNGKNTTTEKLIIK